MGVLNRRDIFTSKFTTALIFDSSNRAFFVAIKNIVGDYFLAEINKQVYAFKLEGSRVLTYRHTLSKTFNLIIYSTDNYLPISSLTNEIEQMLIKNNLPKINNKLLRIIKFGALKEKKDKEPTPFNLLKFVETLKKDKRYEENPDNVNLATFIESLDTKQIVTPLKKVSEFLDSELLATDSKFLGSIVTSLEAVDYEHRHLTNTPINAKKPMMKLMALMLIGILAVVFVFLGYEQGVFDRFLSSLPFIGDGGTDFGSSALFSGVGTDPITAIMQKFPDPVDLKLAVERGEVALDSLPKDVQNMLDTVETPEPQQLVAKEPDPEPVAVEVQPDPEPDPEPVQEEPTTQNNAIEDDTNSTTMRDLN